jgi:predicted CXXCH cytochrome family protein
VIRGSGACVMIEETGKRRRSRIELGYYRAPDRLSRWRGRLCLIAIVAAATWLGASAIASRKATPHGWSLEPSRLASKGPLARPHAIWDSNCAACHVSFAPINGSRWAPTPWAGADAGSKKCATCHAGPAHHQSQRAEDVPDCAECHRDHRGRDASLLAMDDSACTRCHQSLAAHQADGTDTLKVAPTVTRFDREHHPDLTASWHARSADPRRIKFNHALHLAAGLTLEKGGAPLTFAQLSASDRTRYGWKDHQPLNGTIQLDCASCHRSDASERSQSRDRRGANTGEPRSPGAYMLPIVYENHCAACHPLHFDAKLPEAQVRHGTRAQDVLIELKQLYTAEAVKADPELLRQFVPPRPMPGQPVARANQLIQQRVDDQVVTAAKLLFGAALDESVRRQAKLPAGRRGCVECHTLKPAAGPIVSSRSLSTLEIEPPLMTPVWQKHASFNHTTHRALNCAGCHAGANTSKENGDERLLPEIIQCLNCHTSSGSPQTYQSGAASSACTECHRYHNGDHPEQGPGARARRAAIEQTLEQFVSGDQSGR